MTISAIAHSPTGVAYRAVDLTGPWGAGDRTPLVFQHGLGLDGGAWAPWMRRFAGERPMVSIDMRGHGGSQDVWQAPSLEVEDYARDILDVLDCLKIERCHFVGESFGGTVGLYLGVTRPERIASLCVASTGWRGALVNNIADWPAILEEADGVRRWSDMITAGSFVDGVDDPEIRAWAEARQRAMRPEVVAALVLSLRAADLGPDLDKLTMPVLNIVARLSPFVDLAQHEELARRLPDYRQLDFPETKHRVFLTQAKPCAEALADHLTRAEA